MGVEKSPVMAKLAEMAYLDGKKAKSVAKKLGYTSHKFIEDDEAQCHIVWNKDEMVLCFRGTEPTSFNDIKADLNAWPDRAQIGGRVHNGFQEEVNKVWDEIEAVMMESHVQSKLFICGHSLGGAMATIAASRLDGHVDGLYTFGSPRVGTRGMVKRISCSHWRFVNNNDIVTRVPFWIMGYKHHGELVYINHYGNIRKMTSWQRIKDKFRGYKSGLLDGAKDHSMPNYVASTEKAYG
ncbi:MAG: lipase family protein [Candidatus Poseidoniales archaeon]